MPPFILNIPNAITIIRLIMIPLSTLPLLPIFGAPSIPILITVNIAFILASATDFLDGYFARKLNQMTEWGAYMDPLIDKYLIWSMYFVFITITQLNIPLWTFVIILLRDISVTQMRKYAIKHNIKFKTSFLAKCKTATQMVVGAMILLFMLITKISNINIDISYLPSVLVQITAILTLISGLDYAKTLYINIKNK